MKLERKPPGEEGSQDGTSESFNQISQDGLEGAADNEGDAAQPPRKPFDSPLPNIEPLPGEPPKWWNP